MARKQGFIPNIVLQRMANDAAADDPERKAALERTIEITNRALGNDEAKVEEVVQDLHFGNLAAAKMPEDMQKYIQKKVISKSKREVEEKWRKFSIDEQGIHGYFFEWDSPQVRDVENIIDKLERGYLVPFSSWTVIQMENDMVRVNTENSRGRCSDHIKMPKDMFYDILRAQVQYNQTRPRGIMRIN